MCGIAGVIDIESGINEYALNKMVEAIRHRGPDGQGIWVSACRKVGLGHSRLSIIDLTDAGKQPMGNQNGSIQITFNGEIYNYKVLRAQLENKGYRFRSQTDTEVLVYLYEDMGPRMIDLLDGDFAIAIWDDTQKQLFLARDRAGVKPLYFVKNGNRFIFSSEIKAILEYPDIAPEVDPQSLYHYLTYLVVPPPYTLFKGIQKLPAASFLKISFQHDQLNLTQGKYWEPYPNQMEIHARDLDEQFQDLFQRSVEKRMMSDVPVGVLFSGGVDSTLNASVFQKYLSNQKVRTYNIGMSGTKLFHDESQHAHYMAKKLGTEHYSIQISEDDLIDSAQSLIGYQDEPISDPVSVPLYFVTKYAKETGTSVLHAGEGSDELFFGYPKYQAYLKQYEKLWTPLNRFPKLVIRSLAFLVRQMNAPRSKKIADVLVRMSKNQKFFMSSSIGFFEIEKEDVLSREFKQTKLDSFHIVEPLYRNLLEKFPDADLHQVISFIELQLRLPELLLMRVDKMSMANAVEVRVPFLDRDLINFALSVPLEFKNRNGNLKDPVKKFAAAHVGHENVYRPKTGFGAPIQDWFKTRLGIYFQEMLLDSKDEIGQFFNVPVLMSRLKMGPKTVNQAFQLWLIFNFLNWRNRFIK